MGGAVLAPQGLHAGVHDRARLHGEDQARVRPARREDHRSVGRPGRASTRPGRTTSRRRRVRRPTTRSSATADFNVSKLYGMLPADASGDAAERTPADNQTVRNVFVIGPDKKIKLILVYPMTTGRNFDEVLRVIDSLQLTAKHRVATPVNWQQGEDVIIAGSVSDDEARRSSATWESPRPYIRIVPQPRSPPSLVWTRRPGQSSGGQMILKQYYLGCLAHASYLIADQDERRCGRGRSAARRRAVPRRRARARLPHRPRLPDPFPRRLRRRPSRAPRPRRRDDPSRRARARRVRVHADGRRRRRSRSGASAWRCSRHRATRRSRSRSSSTTLAQRRRSVRGADGRHAVHRRRRPPRSARVARLERRGAGEHAVRLAAREARAAAGRDARVPGARRRLAVRQEPERPTPSRRSECSGATTTRCSR